MQRQRRGMQQNKQTRESRDVTCEAGGRAGAKRAGGRWEEDEGGKAQEGMVGAEV